ncbi:quinone oxidoreductase family protein [Paracoccus aerodenitrificans]|uniref:quinone oxidoreductase family protein n=1 Tax=Paracoccus aerodenitrificans TaxID=3017781 RepID=UPI0022F03996|nr:quinone oxidoreductase [Paracoccus aerodenitrificans]WBU64279.1 quinone oxidoreductase [Paracoccus aerodenitrificans]
MRKVVLNEFGGPENLVVETADDLKAGPGEVLIDVEAAGVNFLDVTQRSGASAVHKVGLPLVPGLEGVGRVRELGVGVGETDGLKVGSRVAWMDGRGSYASQVVISPDRIVSVPDDFTLSQGLIFQALTAHYLVHEYRNVKPGDRALVHAASGGVGQLLVQWLKHFGAWVVGTVSTKEKAEAVRALGADEVVVYGRDYDFKDQVLALTDGEGVDLAFDGLGAKTLMNTIGSLRRGGTVVAIGAASGPIPAIEPTVLTPKALRLAGGSVFSFVADPAELRKRAADVVTGIQEGWLQLENATEYPLDGAADAHADLENRRAKGKLYLKP